MNNHRKVPWRRLLWGIPAAALGVLVAQIPVAHAGLVGWLLAASAAAGMGVPAGGFPRRRVLFGLYSIAAGWLVELVPATWSGGVALALILDGAGWVILPTVLYVRKFGTTNNRLARWTASTRRSGGVASWWAWKLNASPYAMRRQIAVLMPSVEDLELPRRRRPWRWLIPAFITWSPIRRWRLVRSIPLTRYATCPVKDGKRPIWVPVEYVTGRVGGPRRGKTGEIACRIVDAPGAVIATSTRTDIVALTAPSRERAGSPIHIFNPGGVGSWASTIKWSPLVGCRVPRIAQDRASDMIPPAGTPEAERWDQQARATLGVLMHAAALRRLPMRAVLAWVSDPGSASADEVRDCLGRSPEAKAMILAADQFFMMNDRTKTSITTAIMPALRWLTDPRAAALGDAVDEGMLDVADLVATRGTVYLLGGEDGLSASLIAAMTAEIARQARIQANVAGGRLDPALTFVLDEAALICPVPLDRWTADMGGRNITIHWCVQGRKQLIQRWGAEAAGTILNNTAVLLVFGGTKDPDDLEAWSKLSGEREIPTEVTNAAGEVVSRSTRVERVFSPSKIAHLPKKIAMVLHADMPACIGRARMAWERKDIRLAIAASPFREVLETSYEDELAGDELELA